MLLGHSIRLAPTCKQEAYFCRACGTERFVYNWGLGEWKRQYEAGEKPSGFLLAKKFNAIRREQFPWTYEVSNTCSARAFMNLQKAFQHFFRRVKQGKKPGYPRFKKRGVRDRFYVPNAIISFDDLQVRVPKLGWVRMRESLRFEGKIIGATVSRRADGWYLSVQVDVGEIRKSRTSHGVVGIDLGLKSSATLSTGEVLQGPKALRAGLLRLRRLSKAHSRKRRGSANRAKASRRLARAHLRVANIRNDWLHKTTTRICRENQAVGIEDLQVQNLTANRRLARAISDEGWGEFRRQLEYKAPMYGTQIVIHPRFYPSSKTCSRCGNVLAELSLGQRVFQCPACGLSLDRDLNAALNLRPKAAVAESSSETVNACGGAVRPGRPRPARQAPAKQEFPQAAEGAP
jgi:putative transposase